MNVITDYRLAIETQCEGHTYILKEPEDLLDYALRAREVSSDLLQAFCQLHPETSPLYLRSVLDERGVKLVGKSSDNALFNIIENSSLKEINAQGQSLNINNRIESDFKNPISMNTKNILGSLEKLLQSGKTNWVENQLQNILNAKEIHQLKSLKFIIQSNEIIKLDDDIEEMFKEVNKDKSFASFYNDLNGKQKYKQHFVNIIQRNEYFLFLIALIRITNNHGMKSAECLLDMACINNWEIPFIRTFLSGQVSNGILPIHNGTDICFNCSKVIDCLGCESNQVNKVKEQLLYLRNYATQEYSDAIRISKDLTPIKGRPAYQKFLFSYNVVVVVKGFLRNMKIIKDDRIMRKDQGQYCPVIDTWRLTDDLLV